MEERDDDIKPQSGRLSATYGAMRILIPEMRHETIVVNLAWSESQKINYCDEGR